MLDNWLSVTPTTVRATYSHSHVPYVGREWVRKDIESYLVT